MTCRPEPFKCEDRYCVDHGADFEMLKVGWHEARGLALIEFLRARLDEAERVAIAARHGGAGKWEQVDPDRAPGRVEDDDGTVTYDEGRPTAEQARHIARHDPASVLAKVAAERQIIDGFAALHHNPARHTDAALHLQWNVLRRVVLVLARVYAEHPDYRESWKP